MRRPRRSSSPVTRAPASMKDPAASMALIFDAMRHPVDPLYEDVAQRRRAAAGTSPAHRPRPVFLVAALVLLGLFIGTAAQALRVPAAVANDRRAQLVDQVKSRQAANDEVALGIAGLRTELSKDQRSALSRRDEGQVAARLQQAEAAAGAGARSGAGLVITLDNPSADDVDAADSDPRTGQDANAITSTDLQQVVNGLWAGGATGVSINGQRITSLSAIRFAGSAVLVNYRPLATPYVVTATGSGLRAAMTSGFSGAYLEGLRKSGFSVALDARDVTVPALAGVRLDHAQVVR